MAKRKRRKGRVKRKREIQMLLKVQICKFNMMFIIQKFTENVKLSKCVHPYVLLYNAQMP